MKRRITIAGAGAAGLSLALQLLHERVTDVEIDLIDRDFEPVSDKTWCFWDQESVLLPGMVRKEWTILRVDGPSGAIIQPILDHTYRMVDSGDFKRLAMREITESGRITLQSKDIDLSEAEDADLVFQSVRQPVRTEPWLKQHFLGLEVETETPVFDPDVATIMDFKVDQSNGFAFMYVLPMSETQALVEYTLFTVSVLEKATYRAEIEAYLDRIAPGVRHTSIREEFGVIPMVVGDWNPGEGRLQNIGGAAGLAKASTGYTFSRIQRDSRQIARSLKTGSLRRNPPSSKRKEWMDSLILRILREDPAHAVLVFETLFRKNGMDLMLKFLDERTTLAEDLRIMASVPSWWEFVKRL